MFWVFEPLSVGQVRGWIEPFGAAAPVAFAALAVGLGLLLVPGAVLAAVAGLLFGPLVGTLTSLTAAVLNSVLALLIARRVGRPGMQAFDSPRVAAVSRALERHGLWAIIAQRLAPGVPDGPCSYAAGVLGVRVWHMALGTAIGAAPRALAYTTLGDAVGGSSSSGAVIGGGLLVVTAIVGFVVAGRIFVDARRGG